jgi:hypothetical protein
MPLIDEVGDHQYAAPAKCEHLKCLKHKELNDSKDTALTCKEKSRPEMRSVGVLANLPPLKTQPYPAHHDPNSFFDTEDIDYFFPSGNPSTN